MAGTIEIAPGVVWDAATWLYDRVLRIIASEVADLELAAEIHGIVGENIGRLALANFEPSEQEEIRSAAIRALPRKIDELSADAQGREVIVHLVTDLLELLRAVEIPVNGRHDPD